MKLFEKEESQLIEVLGKPLVCPVCKNTKFWTKSVLLNTTVATFFNLDWANQNATCFICSECTHISWFLGKE